MKRQINMKNGNQSEVGKASHKPVGQASRKSVGQASRLSLIKWRRHLPHYQLSTGYYFITFATHNRILLHPPQKDCVFNAHHKKLYPVRMLRLQARGWYPE